MQGTEFLQVQDVQVFAIRGVDLEQPPTLPFLRFVLENNSDFIMSNIPVHIAVEISMHQSGTEVNDSRLKIHDLVGQLAIIHRVEIDSLLPGTSVYQATISLTPEGFSQPVHFPMIPSNATLLAVLNNAPIYVSKRLWEEYIEATKMNITFEDENLTDDFLDDD